MLKRTYRYGAQTKIEYARFYENGHHLGRNNPAELLNSWTSMGVGENPKEIPYSAEAALFFHRMLLGMAEISRRVQEATFTPQKLQELIAAGNNQSMLMFETADGMVPSP